MPEIDVWWESTIASRLKDGRSDASRGIYDPPYPGSEDPQDQSENTAYWQGWSERRKELGNKFEWQ